MNNFSHWGLGKQGWILYSQEYDRSSPKEDAMLFSLGTNFSPVALAVLTLESWQSLESLLLLLWKLDVTVCHFQPLPHPLYPQVTSF